MVRHILGYNQGQFANILGITRQHLGKVESGEVELQRTLTIALMTVVIHISRQLDKDSMKYKLINVYVEIFEDMIRKLVYLGEV